MHANWTRTQNHIALHTKGIDVLWDPPFAYTQCVHWSLVVAKKNFNLNQITRPKISLISLSKSGSMILLLPIKLRYRYGNLFWTNLSPGTRLFDRFLLNKIK